MKKKSFAIGYALVIHSILMYILCSFVVGLSANYVIPAASAKFGMESGLFYNINTAASLISVIAAFFLVQWTLKAGVKIVTTVSLACSAIGAVLIGCTSSLTGYVIGTFLLFSFAQGYGFAVTNTLMSNWFPRKKAEILGITTTGSYLTNLTITPAFAYLLGSSGLKSSMLLLFTIMAIMAVASIFWVIDYPENVGLFPDNQKEGLEQLQISLQNTKNHISPWTIGKLLKTPIVWFFIICFGFMLLMSSGMPAQLVPLMISRGIQNPTTVMMISAIFGLIGSICTGFIDGKIGTRNTTIIMCIIFMFSLAVLALISSGPVTIAMICLWTFFAGGCFNMCPSLAITIFGAKEYNAVNRIIHPMTQVIKSLSFVAIGVGSSIGSKNSGTMWIFLICIVISLIFVLPIKPNKLIAPQNMR